MSFTNYDSFAIKPIRFSFLDNGHIRFLRMYYYCVNAIIYERENMLTVSESAIQLGVSSARIRALIKAGTLPAIKHGREWMLREEDVLQRIASKPRAGRPKLDDASFEGTAKASSEANAARAHEVYKACQEIFRHCPSAEMMKSAESQEEAAFYMAASTFFLQQQQATLIANGVF